VVIVAAVWVFHRTQPLQVFAILTATLTSIASNVSTPLSSVLQSFSVNFGLIYFKGERRNPSAPDVTRR
jgi:hypothetical protein